MIKIAIFLSYAIFCMAAVATFQLKEKSEIVNKIRQWDAEMNARDEMTIIKIDYASEPPESLFVNIRQNQERVLQRRKRQISVTPPRTSLGFPIWRCSTCPMWTSWHGGQTCSATCGTGGRVLRRYCNNETPTRKCRGPAVTWELCNEQPCPEWSSWAPVSNCSDACGEGLQRRRRDCMSGEERATGCAGESEDAVICPQKPNCKANWGEWTEFTACSRSCGEDGTQHRTRLCQMSTDDQTESCEGRAVEFKRCNVEKRCPLTYSEWTEWSECDTDCGVWTTLTRNRTCVVEPCEKDAVMEEKLCEATTCGPNVRRITRNKNVHAWTSWSVCSETCGVGVQMRSRRCNRTSPYKTVCDAAFSEKRPCSTLSACPQWASWNACDQSCDKTPGVCMRSRECVLTRRRGSEKRPAEIGGGRTPSTTRTTIQAITATLEEIRTAMSTVLAPATESLSKKIATATAQATDYVQEITSADECDGGLSASREIRKCSSQACAPDWSQWLAWSACSSSCGAGVRHASRSCNRTLSEAECTGPTTKYAVCYAPPCWSEWSVFSSCTVSCGKSGLQSRWRECMGTNEKMPQYAACNGTDLEIVRCNTQDCPPMWSSWTPWSGCSKSCGGGEKTRTRTCLRGNCTGESVRIRTCNNYECPFWSPWTGFTCCSVTCGTGYRSRKRKCFLGEPGEDGCPGSNTDEVKCHVGECYNVTAEIEAIPNECGIRYSKGNLRKSFLRRITANVQRVAGGNVSQTGAWPWQVSLQRYLNSTERWEHICAGTLLSAKWVLSAAHCTLFHPGYPDLQHENVSWKYTVLMGSIKKNGDKTSQRIEIKRIFVHHNYRGSSYGLSNDIELIMLRTDARLTRNVLPACLPYAQMPSSNDTCYVTGWGRTGFNDSETEILLEAQIPIMDFNQCLKTYLAEGKYINSRFHMCAGSHNSSEDTCKADSGGPLVCVGSDRRWYVAGITSWGLRDCDESNGPGIYVPVSHYEDWIRNIMTNKIREAC